MMYSKEERDEQVKKMREVATKFYPAATHTGCHTFIEFCGFMMKFIDVCSVSSEKGIDFNEANAHTGEVLVAADHDIMYLAEKFDCIFGPTLADPKKREVFFKAMGWEARESKPVLVDVCHRLAERVEHEGFIARGSVEFQNLRTELRRSDAPAIMPCITCDEPAEPAVFCAKCAVEMASDTSPSPETYEAHGITIAGPRSGEATAEARYEAKPHGENGWLWVTENGDLLADVRGQRIADLLVSALRGGGYNRGWEDGTRAAHAERLALAARITELEQRRESPQSAYGRLVADEMRRAEGGFSTTDAPKVAVSAPNACVAPYQQPHGELPTGWDVVEQDSGTAFCVEGPWCNTKYEARETFFALTRASPTPSATEPGDWTDGNKSPAYLALVEVVAGTIANCRVGDPPEMHARTIVSRLAHIHDMAPRTSGTEPAEGGKRLDNRDPSPVHVDPLSGGVVPLADRSPASASIGERGVDFPPGTTAETVVAAPNACAAMLARMVEAHDGSHNESCDAFGHGEDAEQMAQAEEGDADYCDCGGIKLRQEARAILAAQKGSASDG